MVATVVEAIAAAAYLDGGESAMVVAMQTMGLTDPRLESAGTMVTSKQSLRPPVSSIVRARYACSLMWLLGPPPIAGPHAIPNVGD